MAKIPPQFQKKSLPPIPPTKKGPPSPKTIAPSNRKVIDAPNAEQDDALAAARNALVGPKTPPAKGLPKGKLPR